MIKFAATGNPRVDIPNLIRWRGNGLTFVELVQYLPYLEGESAFINRDANIVFWSGISSDCVDTLIELINAGTIRPTSTHPLTYYVDGQVPNFPVAKSNRKYRKPHWAPITFSLVKNAA